MPVVPAVLNDSERAVDPISDHTGIFACQVSAAGAAVEERDSQEPVPRGSTLAAEGILQA